MIFPCGKKDTGKPSMRDSIKAKVLGREGMGVGEGEGNLSPERFPSPSPIFPLTR